VVDVLRVSDLVITYRTPAGLVRAVDGVDFSLPPASMLGLVGESGCGKTTLARALMGVLPANARVAEGRIELDGLDLLGLPLDRRREMLWRDISFIPQSAMNSLDPVYTLRKQMREVLCGRGGFSADAADKRAAELFASVGLGAARLADYPHQFSGGMRQRAAIALALALQPKLVIADEPVTALDVIVQRQVLDMFGQVGREMGVAAIFVTHDISVVAYLCSITAVMYAGRIVEYGPTEDVLARPAHPYTMGLMNAFPDLESSTDQLAPIEGSPPDLAHPPWGCRFAPRCPFVEERCRAGYPEIAAITPGDAPGHWAACWRTDEAISLRRAAAEAKTWLS
jgi:peptide/nickel transport system ATP-binding protein